MFVGRLVPYKGADMLLQAAAEHIRTGSVEVTIVGDGPEMPHLREIVDREKITSGVTLTGWIAHEKLQDILCDMDIFGFPSIREFGGAVVLEAMALGVVPIVVAYGGPGELVTPATGLSVSIGSRDHIIKGFSEAFARLIANPSDIDRLSAAAYNRAHDLFTWSAKAQQILQVYEWVSHPQSPKPVFPCPLPDST